MPLAAGLALSLLVPEVAWRVLKDGGVAWSAKAIYPEIKGPSALHLAFNKEVKRVAEALFYQAAHDMSLSSSPKGKIEVSGVLGMVNDRVATALVYFRKEGQPLELHPVSLWLNSGQPVRAVFGNLVAPGADISKLLAEKLLPRLNGLRAEGSLPPMSEFPAGFLDGYVLTTLNVCWIVPPGVAGTDAAQVKVPLEEIKAMCDKQGVLAHMFGVLDTTPVQPPPKGNASVPVSISVKWPWREWTPPKTQLLVSLYRNRDDAVPLASLTMPSTDPPMEVRHVFGGLAVEQGDRLYLDVRIVSEGKTYFRNKDNIRVPAEGWQTVHKIDLQVERADG